MGALGQLHGCTPRRENCNASVCGRKTFVPVELCTTSRRGPLEREPYLGSRQGSTMMRLLVFALTLSSYATANFAPAPAPEGEEGEGGGDEGGGDDEVAKIFMNPQNIGILFALLMFILIAIYCLAGKIYACCMFVWNSWFHVPCCLTCKWVCVPCYNCTRDTIARCTTGCCKVYDSCDFYYHPWKRMEVVTSIHNGDECCCC